MTPAEREDYLFQRAKSGDRIAKMLLMDLMWPKIRRRLSMRIPHSLRSIIEPDDFFSVTALAVWQVLPRFVRRGPDAIERFMSTIALCRLRDKLRRLRHEHLRVPISETATEHGDDAAFSSLLTRVLERGSTPSRILGWNEAIDRLRAAFKELSPTEQLVLWLHYCDQLSLREVGRQINLPATPVRRLHDQALEQLRRDVGPRSKYLSSII